MKFFKLLAVLALSLTAACASVNSVGGDNVRLEVAAVGNGTVGEDITAYVADFRIPGTDNWVRERGVTNSPTLMKTLIPALLPGVAVESIRRLTRQYEIDNACTECGDVYQFLSTSSSTSLSASQVESLIEILGAAALST